MANMCRFLFVCFVATVTLLKPSNAFPTSLAIDRAAAIELAEAIDPSVDPCQDFFQYACGSWLKNNPIPKSQSSWSQFDILDQQKVDVIKGILEKPSQPSDSGPLVKARKMYAACMDTDSIEAVGLSPLTDFIGQFGGWPMTLTNWNESTFDWKTVSSSASYGMDFFLAIYNAPDSKNTTFSSIYVDQGSLSLSRSFLTNYTSKPNVFKAYTELIVDSAKAIRDSLGSKASDSQIRADVDAILKFESQLALITVSEDERRNNTIMYNPMSISELQNWTDSENTTSDQSEIDWYEFLSDIYSVANVTIAENERIIVVEPHFLKDLVHLLDKTPPRVIANYVHWRMVYDLSVYTNKKMDDLFFTFSKIFDGISEHLTRAGKCTNAINELMGYALGADFVAKVLDEEAVVEVKAMVVNLKKAFKSLVKDATWMDSTTKSIAIDKVDAMIEFIGYPQWILNKTAVEEYYDGLATPTGSHFNNIIQINAFLNEEDLSTLRDITNRSDWNSAPTVVNAFYSDNANAITFPAAILQSPYFVKGRSAAMNYGAIGSVIGHEITHGFDDQGRQNDKFGNTVQWWTEETLVKFQDRAKCFIDQYANYTVINGTHLDGVNTQGENVADNGGLREALRAYHIYVAENGVEAMSFENLSPDQVFFLSYAYSFCGASTPEATINAVQTDPHSPHRQRVIGTLSNNEDFVRAFKCEANMPMNRLNKCVLW